MVTKRVRIHELTSPTLTRRRGRIAFESLLEHLEGGDVEIDLSDYKGPLSLSFLDELTLRLRERGLLNRVLFLAPPPKVREKLSRIASLRDVELLYRSSPRDEARPIPKKKEPGEALSPVLTPLDDLDS